jgi:glycerol kinase
MSLILAVDQSTSATKAMLFSIDGRLLDKESLSHRQIYPQPGWVEHDAEEIYQNTVQAIGNLAQRNAARLSETVGLSITNQRETFVVFERGTGKPLYNAIVWQCTRGEGLCRELAAAGHGPRVQELTGLVIDTYFPASKLAWLLEARPDVRQKLEQGQALFGTIDAYLVYRLTGGRVFATDATNASRTLFYDINRLVWSEELAGLFGVPLQALPEVRESSACFGETDVEGRLPARLPIYGVMGDSQAALFAQRCFQPGRAKVTFGTGSSLLLNIGAEKKISHNGIVTAVGWLYQGRPTYAFEGITNFTGATIAWLKDRLGLIQTAEESESLANSVADNGGVYLVPAFVGLSAPYWRPDARAGILGLTSYSTRAHVARAALESIGFIVNDVLQLMSQEAGLALESINADGGAVRNQFLMQFVADVTRLTVRAANLPELSALGAVFSGALGLGLYSSLEALESLPAGFVDYIPKMAAAQVDGLRAGWQRAVRQILTI